MGFDARPFYLDTSRFDNALGDMFGAIKKKREDEASLGLINALGGGGDPSMGMSNALAVPSSAPLAPSAPVPPVLQAGYGRESGPGASGNTNLVDAIKGFEGYTPKSQWDYKQYSVGYGTRGAPGEVIDKPEAERRLGTEVGKARSIVEQFAPNAPAGVKDALTSLTFNSGADWTKAGLGAAVQRGDWADAKSRFLQYNRAGGSVNQGLVNRRNQEAQWFDGGVPQAAAAQPTSQAQPVRVADASGVISPQVVAWMRANPSHPMTQEILGKIAEQRLDPMAGLRTQKAQLDVQNAITEQQRGHLEYFGKKALAISQMDPATAAQVWPRVLAEHKQLFPNDEITAEEADPITGPKLMMAEAGLFNDPRVKEKGDLELEKMRAEVKALGQKDAVSEYMMKMLTQPDQDSASASPIQPQSFSGVPQQPRLQNISNIADQPARDTNLIRVADDGQDGAAEQQNNGPANPGAVYSMPGGEMVQTPFGQMTRDKARKVAAAVALKGNAALSKILMDAATGGGGQLSKAATTQIDKDEIAATNSVATLDAIKKSYDQKYLNIPNRIKLWGKDLAAKFGEISPEDQADLKGYAQFRQSAWHNLNRVLKDLSGTAVTENEMERQLLDLPNPGQGITDGDSPPDFEAKLKGAIAFQHSAIARARFLRSQGFTGKPWEAGIAVEDMPNIVNQRGAEIESQLRQQNPKADPMQLQKAVKAQIKQEFGI